MARGRRHKRQCAPRLTERPLIKQARGSPSPSPIRVPGVCRIVQADVISYEYGQLQSTDAIRVLSLHAGTPADPLMVSLETTVLDRLPDIQALSYVWGNTSRTHIIKCNKKSLGITSNLKHALRAIRHPTEHTLLWVDAICIAQENARERNHQIKHMSRIYSEAKNVLVWLGPDPDRSGRMAFEFAHQLVTDKSFQETTFQNWWANRSRIDYLRELSTRDWFHRMWTMQEIGLASSAIVLCGQSRISWDTLYCAYELFNSRLTFNNLRCLQFRPDRIALLYRWITTGKERSFLELLELSQSRGATDPRDRVFALMSHPSAQKKPKDSSKIAFLVEPDYTKDINAVYVAVAEQLMKKKGHLDVLSHVRSGDAISDLPTWAPAWQLPPMSNCLLDSKQKFSACGRPGHAFSSCVPKFHKNKFVAWARHIGYNGVLEVGAIDIGKVSWCSSSSSSMEMLALNPNSRMKETWEIVKRRFPLHTGPQLLKIFSDVSTCGLLHPKYLQTENARQLYVHELSAYWRHIWAGKPEAELIPRLGNTDISPKQFASAAWHAWKGRVLFYTQNGFLGLGPASLNIGDDVRILEGGKVPFALRANRYYQYALIGECYVSGVMHGEKVQRAWTISHIV